MKIREVITEGINEAHPNSKIYDKCWDGYRKVPGKKRGEKGSCKKIGEELSLDEQFDTIEEMVEAWAEHHGVDSELIWEDFESVEDDELLSEAEAWQTSKGKNKIGRAHV